MKHDKPPTSNFKKYLNAYTTPHIRDAQLLCLLMEANALDKKFERHFFETFLPKGLLKARNIGLGLCQKFDKAGYIFDYFL